MEFNKCLKCSQEYMFKRAVCSKCGSDRFTTINVETATVIDSVHLIATPEQLPDEYNVVLFLTPGGGKGFCRSSMALKSGDTVHLRQDEVGSVCEPL